MDMFIESGSIHLILKECEIKKIIIKKISISIFIKGKFLNRFKNGSIKQLQICKMSLDQNERLM